MLSSPTAENKRVFQLKQECIINPEMKRSIRTSPTIIPINIHNRQLSLQHEQEVQQSQQLQLQLQQQHRLQQQRVVTSASLPPHQKVHAIQIFRDLNSPSNDVVGNSASNQGCYLHSNVTNATAVSYKGMTNNNSSFLPPINPSSAGSLKKKKKINFISNAVAALTNNKSNTGNLFNRNNGGNVGGAVSKVVTASSTPSSRNASPMRRQTAVDVSPSRSRKKCSDTNTRQSTEVDSSFKRPSLFSKSSSNPTLAETTKPQRSSSRPSPSPTRQKASASPVKKQPLKQNSDNNFGNHPYRRMSLPLNKNMPQQCCTNIGNKVSQQQSQQKSKPQISSGNEVQQAQSIWQAAYHRPQHSEPATDAGLLLFAPASQNFIHSQRLLSRAKGTTQGVQVENISAPIAKSCWGALPSQDRPQNFSDEEIAFPETAFRKKENIYEEIGTPLKNGTKYEIPITMTTSSYQSPSLSSSSSSSSFFLSGRNESNSGERLERIKNNQKSLDDGYSSQDCQNPAQQLQQQNFCNDIRAATMGSIPTASNRTARPSIDAMTGSVNEDNAIRDGRIKLERHFSLDEKNSRRCLVRDQNSYQGPLEMIDNDSSSDDYGADVKHRHSSDCNPASASAIACKHIGELRPSNVRLGSRGPRCGLISPRRVPNENYIGVYQTLPKIGNGGAGSKCFYGDRSCESEMVCRHGDDSELRRLRMLIWTERKNNEEREAEVERRWVARMEGVVAEARSIEQSLRSQLQQLRKQFVHLQDQLRKNQEQSRNKLSTFESSTQTKAIKESNVSNDSKDLNTRRGMELKSDRNTSLCSSCSSIASNDAIVTESITAAANGDNEITLQRLVAELERCKAAMEGEKKRWMNEKTSVIEYQQRLQLNYIQVMKKNELLTEELHLLTTELEKLHHNQQQKDEE